MDWCDDYGFSKTPSGRIRYGRRHGDGKKLVLVHGLAATMGSWHKLAERLPKGIDIYAIDLPGHGGSDAPREFTVSAQASILSAFIGKHVGGSFYLMGHSYGGWVSAYFASFPSLSPGLEGLILEDPSGLYSHLGEMDDGAKGEYISGLSSVLKGKRTGAAIRVVKRFLLEGFNGGHLTGELLARIAARTLILWGREDGRIPVAHAHEFRRGIPDSTLSIVDGARHTPHYTHPGIVARRVSSFMKG